MEFDFVTMIVNQGFAVAVAIYSLTRLEKTMKENTSVLAELVTKLESISRSEDK